MKIFEFVKDRYVNPEYPFSDRLYFLFGTAGAISAGAAFVAAIASGLPRVAAVASLASFFIMLVIMIASFFMKNFYINRIVCACFLNFFMFPVLFWVTGGINCGMVFYFLLGLCVATLILDGMVRNIILLVTLCLDTFCLYIGFTRPDLMYQLSFSERMSDTISSFLIVALFIIAVIVIMSREYAKEHKKVVAYNQVLQKEAVTDPMTTLYNQRYLHMTLQKYIKSADAARQESALIMFDIDDFKRINDHYGHICGNQVLCQFASILKDEAGDGNVVIRYGGEEFIIFLPSADGAVAFQLAEKIRRSSIEDKMLSQLSRNKFSVSGGVAQYQGESTIDQWISKADQKLYEAKTNGKNQIRY